jgi:hypothetical protein
VLFRSYLTVKTADVITPEEAETATAELATRKAAAQQASETEREDDLDDESDDDSDIIDD